jgi:hypothetical protein
MGLTFSTRWTVVGGDLNMTLQGLGPDLASPLFHHSERSDDTGSQHRLYGLVL